MNLLLQREPSASGCTIGRLAIDGVFACWTLEDVVRPGRKLAHETAIPAGRYAIVMYRSPRFGCVVPRLVAVPDFDAIEIHAGNTAADTSGCILVGQTRGANEILGSRRALAALQPRIATAIARGELVHLTIVNAVSETQAA